MRGITGPQSVSFDQFELSVARGVDVGLCRTFGQELVQVGTARSNDFVLRDPTVSRFHLKIETAGHNFTLVDADSTNGTYLGGFRFRTAFLEKEATITLGNTELRFTPLGRQAVVDLPARDQMGGILGGSPRMRELYTLVERAAGFNIPLIIEGETGTGKELVARTIHELSPRAAHPFEVLDCGALPDNLIESELFGHVKGAFTGADRERQGVFETADGGTVFLDELGELRANLQPKLLRVLETGEIKRVGGSTMHRVDVRIIGATHRSLSEMVNKNLFREDLYYRLAGHKIRVPPLRERREDIPQLAEHFLKLLRQGGNPSLPATLDDETLAAFADFPWPGNVRQLRRAVERVAMFGVMELTAPRRIEGDRDYPGGDPSAMTLRAAREVFERRYLTNLMRRFAGDTKAAATASDMHPKSLLRLLRQHGLDGQE
jgi:DNA-binding NtrC family response regulator